MIWVMLHWAKSCVWTPSQMFVPLLGLCGFAACSSLLLGHREVQHSRGLVERCWKEKKRGKKTSALFANQKQMFWGFWRRSYCYVVSPCAWLWGGKMKTASRLASCWVQIKITVRRQEQLLRETGWHTEWWGSASHTSWHSISLKLVQLYSPWPWVSMFSVCASVCACVWSGISHVVGTWVDLQRHIMGWCLPKGNKKSVLTMWIVNLKGEDTL